MRAWRTRLTSFLFREENSPWVSILRVGLGIQIIAYCLLLRSEWTYLFSANGLLGREVPEALLSFRSPLIPRLGWLIAAGQLIGISELPTLQLIWVALLLGGVFLVLGFMCRTSAGATWFLHLCAANSGGLFSYGVDNFMTIGLFYLMLAPLPDRYALDAKLRHIKSADDASMNGFFRRVLQLHLCVIYFFSGLPKALGTGWWNGESIWRALTREPFNVVPPEVLVSWKPILPALGVSVWVIELTYPFLIWPKRTRLISLALICALHFGIALAMSMYLFGLVMIVLNLAAFAPVPFRLDAIARALPRSRRRAHEDVDQTGTGPGAGDSARLAD
jgi:hypothetical protein